MSQDIRDLREPKDIFAREDMRRIIEDAYFAKEQRRLECEALREQEEIWNDIIACSCIAAVFAIFYGVIYFFFGHSPFLP